jgi:hypothetical protein
MNAIQIVQLGLQRVPFALMPHSDPAKITGVDPDVDLIQMRMQLDLHRFCSSQVLLLCGPLFEGHG